MMRSLNNACLAGFAMLILTTSSAQAQSEAGEPETREQANQKVVTDFIEHFFGKHDVRAAERYLAPDLIQHYPGLPDGRDALIRMLEQRWAANEATPPGDEALLHIGAEADLVWIHRKTVIKSKPTAVVDIFRLVNGVIVEHWDVFQEVPQNSLNPHPLF